MPMRRRAQCAPLCYLKRTPYLFLAPFLIWVTVFTIFPVVFTFALSFLHWDGLGTPVFAGAQNYLRLIRPDSRFLNTIGNTLIIMGMSIPVSIALALVMAAALSNPRILGRKAMQLFNFAPYITTPVAIGLIWAILFDLKYGTINQVLMAVGVIQSPVNWLGDPGFARCVLALVLIWKYYGYLTVLFVAGIAAIPKEHYEAATVDGAGSVQQFFSITLPSLRPVMTFVIVTSMIGGLQMFDEPYLLFKGGLTSAQPYGGPGLACLTMVMNFYDIVYRAHDWGFGATLAYGMFLVVAVFSFISLKLLLRREDA